MSRMRLIVIIIVIMMRRRGEHMDNRNNEMGKTEMNLQSIKTIPFFYKTKSSPHYLWGELK